MSKKIALSSKKDQRLYGEWMKFQTEISKLQSELFSVKSKADRERYAEIISKMEQEIGKLEREQQELVTRMTRENPKFLDLTASKPVSLEALQQDMKKHHYEVLQYLVLEHGLILWHISNRSVHVRNIFFPRSELITKVAALRSSLSDRNAKFDDKAAREMFLFLVQPALAWIKTDHLVIIPHEDLNYVPFQVFKDSESSFFGERFRISYAPSATVLMGLKKAEIAEGKLFAIADPMINEAPDEVEAIARLYQGRNKIVKKDLAKEADVKAWAGAYEILHFSVHGKFIPQEPLLSFLNLAGGSGDDGKLTAAEMFGLPLEKAQLVVLSACETGRTEATHANEILGMVRALLYAGANSLILSTWEVDSASTSLWMETFYKEAKDKPLSEAARLALMTVKKHPQYSQPFYWGAFLMIGK
jgi:CHAT domain-containing protein